MKRMDEFRIHRVMLGKVHTYLALEYPDRDCVVHQFLTDREDGGFFQSCSTQCLFMDREHQNVCCGMEEDTAMCLPCIRTLRMTLRDAGTSRNRV